MSDTDLPLHQQPSAQKPSVGQPSVEQPPPEEPSTEQPSTEQPYLEQPPSESSDLQTNELAAGHGNPDLDPLLRVALTELQSRRQQLEQEIKDLSNRKSQLEKELSNSFAGQSDSIARKVKGFQDYLAGAFQDLAQSVERLELVVQPVVVKPSPLDQAKPAPEKEVEGNALAVADTFKPDEELIRECLDQFLSQPDFYADPWKLRRSLDPSDKGLLEDWFFNQGGRGAQPSRGGRARNILVAAALIAIVGELYGDRFQSLVLASKPERLGEWRRGLQDALGLGREDFGPSSGIVLFERGDALVERADRLEERGEVPLILVDAAEQSVEIPVLQFPLWLAFAAGPQERFEDEELI
ncbi:MAG: DUF3086 domain-containing protein [Prochlorococcus sp.]|tara:strand:+ start:1645 stop:2706 length:1062 start_codon:yes stop_codon:yes gene_type:complete